MNAIEQRLIELNDALLRLSKLRENANVILHQQVAQAAQVLSAGQIKKEIPPVSNEVMPSNVIKIVPKEPEEHKIKQPIIKECNSNCVLVDSDYVADENNFYIGVNSKTSITISLPTKCDDLKQIIIKSEMKPPLEDKEIKVTTIDGSLIDGFAYYTISAPYESLRLICRGGDWYIL